MDKAYSKINSMDKKNRIKSTAILDEEIIWKSFIRWK